jgi:hypothetical protein
MAYVASGLSVIPVRADGSKAPVERNWQQYARRVADEKQLVRWFAGRSPRGIGIACGPASRNFTVLDFELAAAYDRWRALIPSDTVDFLDPCPIVRTPSGGYHVWIRLSEPHAGTVLARRPDPSNPAKGKTLIEVRGDGHQVLAPGCPPECHPSRRLYEWVERGWLDKPGDSSQIPIGVFATWCEVASSLNEWTSPARSLPSAPPRPRDRHPSDKDPGTDFSRRGTWEEAGLFEAGWTWERQLEFDRGYVRRPGKGPGEGHSGTLGFVTSREHGWPLFHCFTSNGQPFEAGRSYDRFGVYTRLKHGGNFAAAARDLAARGFGERIDRNGHGGDGNGGSEPPQSVSSGKGDEDRYPPPIRGEAWNDPHRLARLFAAEHRTNELSTLIQWRDEFYQWVGSAWESIADSELDARVARFARDVFEADYPKRVEESERAANGHARPPKIYPVTSQVRANVRLNLSGLLTHHDAGLDPPFWLDGKVHPDPTSLIAAPNGLFTLNNLAGDRKPIAAPTPRRRRTS